MTRGLALRRSRVLPSLLVVSLLAASTAASGVTGADLVSDGVVGALHAATGMTAGGVRVASHARAGIAPDGAHAAAHAARGMTPRPIPARPIQPPNLSSGLATLARTAARDLEARDATGRLGLDPRSLAAERTVPLGAPGLITHVEAGTTFVAVSIELDQRADPSASATAGAVRLGGRILNVAPGVIEADVPAAGLPILAIAPGVRRISPVLRPILDAGPVSGGVVSAGVSIHGADAWQQAGYGGQGVRIGVIDGGFEGLTDRLATEFPGGVRVRCYTSIGTYGTATSACENGEVHGTAVAETIADMAPGATLYLADPISDADTRQAVAWMTGQGARIINASFGSGAVFEGPGDGTSPASDSLYGLIASAVAGGALWVNSAGNSGDLGWAGPWTDGNGNGWLEFSGTDETNALDISAGERLSIAIRWDDPWGTARDDYDLYLYAAGDPTPIASSTDVQAGAGDPVERIDFTALVSGAYEIQVSKHAGAAAKRIQLLVEHASAGLAYEVPAGTLPSPADSRDPGMVTVGAVGVASPDTVETYSSRGPTTDGRTKPDLVAVDCADTSVYPRFCGTSQSAPYVAGAAALLYQADPGLTPAGLAEALRAHVVPLGQAPNADTGWGRLWLGPAPSVPPPQLPPLPPPGPPPLGVASLTPAGTAAGWRALAAGTNDLVHVAFVQRRQDGDAVVYRHSSDGGASFDPGIPLSTPGAGASRAAVAAAGAAVHVAWLEGDLAGVGPIVVRYRSSADGGVTWTAATVLSPLDGRAGDPAVAADAAGHVLVAWTDGLTGRITVVASADDGVTWAPPRVIGSTTLGPPDSPGPLDGLPAVAFGSGGRGYVTWASGEARILLRRTPDAGVSWLPVQTLDRLADGSSRTWLSAYGGGVAVVYAGRPTSTGRSFVVVRRSGDAGATWAARRSVAAAPALAAAAPTPASFGPAVAARGLVLRVAYGQCTTAACTRSRLWYRQSADGGTTWSTPVALTGTTTYAWPIGLAATSRILVLYESAASSAATRGTAYLRIR